MYLLGQTGVQNGYQAATVADGSLVGATRYNRTCACCSCGMGVAPIYVLGYWNSWSPGDNTDKFDPLVASTLLRWGNYDYFSASTRWDAQELPAQLCYETSNLGGGGAFDPSKCY